MKAGWLRKIATIILLTAVLVWMVRAPWQAAFESLRPLSLPWVALGVVIGMASMSLRALRLAWAFGAHVPVVRVWRATIAGYLASAFLPLGAGEFVKMGLLKSHASMPGTRALAAVVLDRLLDAAALVLLLAWVAGRHLFPVSPGVAAWTLGFCAGAATLLLMTAGWWLPRGRRWIASRPWSATRVASWSSRWDHMAVQVERLRDPHYWMLAGPILAAVFALDILGTLCLLKAHPATAALPPLAGAQTTAFVMLAFAMPALPGGLGAYQAAWVLSTASFGCKEAVGLALGLAGQAAHTLSVALLGAMALPGLGGLVSLLRAWKSDGSG